MTRHILSIIALPSALRDGLAHRYRLHERAPGEWDDAAVAEVQAVVTNGSIGLTAAQMDGLPRLRVVCSMGAGT